MKKIFFAGLLVAGTCIGGGVLALPVLTSQAGFYPSLLLFFLSWLTMAATGFLFLEATSWMEGDTNILSMATATLGRLGRSITWVLYLFLFYCLTIAYMDGCGNIVEALLFHAIPDWSGPIFFTLIVAPFITSGAKMVSRLNAFFMIGLGVSYFAFVFLGWKEMDFDALERANWTASGAALPVILLSFGFQGIVPTLTRYLEFDVKKARFAILLGSLIPFVAYVIWQALILGIVPLSLLDSARQAGVSAVQPLREVLNQPLISTFGVAFSFFALTTSFFGVTLGLRDFLADGLEIEKDRQGRIVLSFLVFVPPMIIAVFNPRLFLTALKLAGNIGGTLLLGLLPIAIVWSGRYWLRLPGERLLPGGKAVLTLLALFLLMVLFGVAA